MSSVNFSTVRSEVLHTYGDVGLVGAHGRRELGKMEHVDRSRTHLNRYLVGTDDPVADVKALVEREGLTKPKNCNVTATHLLLLASPGYFRPNGEGPGEWDQKRLDDWVAANMAWVSKRFPGMVAHARLDLDEATPHLDVLVVPFYEKKTKRGVKRSISHSKVFNHDAEGKDLGRGGYAVLQTDYNEAVKHLGLERGKEQSGADHVQPLAWLKDQMAALERERAALAAKEAAVAAKAAEQIEREQAQAARAEYLRDVRDKLVAAKRDLEQEQAAVAAERAALAQEHAAVVAERRGLERRAVVVAAKEAGLEAIASGELVDADREGGRSRLLFAHGISPERIEAVESAVEPARPWVWGVAKRLGEVVRSRVDVVVSEVEENFRKVVDLGLRQVLARKLRRLVPSTGRGRGGGEQQEAS